VNTKVPKRTAIADLPADPIGEPTVKKKIKNNPKYGVILQLKICCF